MVGLFGSLVEIDIISCESIKEIVVSTNENTFQPNLTTDVVIFHQLRSLRLISLPTLADFFFEENATNEGDNQVFKSFFSNKVAFPKLEILEMFSVNIQYMWSNQLLHNSFSNLKILAVKDSGILVKLIPFHILKCLTNLEELVVGYCSLLEMVFDFEELKSANKEIYPLRAIPLKKLNLFSLPKLKHVWSNDLKGIVSFQSLRRVQVDQCESLTSMFPASIAKSLLQLEELAIENCGIEVLVAKDEVLESVATFEFPKLTSLYLYDLDKMKNFYPRTHLLECPGLQRLIISQCGELEIFGKEISSSSRLQEEKACHTKYPLFFQEKQIPKLKELDLDRKHATMIWNGQLSVYHFRNVRVLWLYKLTDETATFPYGLLNRFPNLKELRVDDSSIQEIFSCTDDLGDAAGQIAPFRTLSLVSIEKAKHIWNVHSQMDLFLQNLQSLSVLSCSDLINLGPSSVSLKNLTDLEVRRCDGLLNLLTSSTARSLEQLTRLLIIRCSKIEEIITKEGEDVEKEIVFRKLEHLNLYSLPCLKSFCSHNYTVKFPLLNEVRIDGCPNLEGIEMIRNEKRWEINF